MHVDGGASAQVFVYPPGLQLQNLARAAGITRERRLYVIRNARRDPRWQEIKRSTFPIVSRAVSSLIQAQGLGDLYRMYLAANRDGVRFNLANIPESFETELKEPFDQQYMIALFQLGYNLGAGGYPWAKFPPGYSEPGACLAAPFRESNHVGTGRTVIMKRVIRVAAVALATAISAGHRAETVARNRRVQ
jgi:hypothetical protein